MSDKSRGPFVCDTFNFGTQRPLEECVNSVAFCSVIPALEATSHEGRIREW